MNETKTVLVGFTTKQDTNEPICVVAAKSPLLNDCVPINIIEGNRAASLWEELVNKYPVTTGGEK